MSTDSSNIPKTCDYLVVGGGATGMSFVDTLLAHYHNKTDDCENELAVRTPISVVMVDPHVSPGGQWHDSYSFVRLHQPSSMYGVETEPLEDQGGTAILQEKEEHRATRQEILEYYDRVRQKLEKNYDFHFVGGVTFDLSQLKKKNRENNSNNSPQVYQLQQQQQGQQHDIRVTKRVVDARFLQPDIPIFVPPKFTFDSSVIPCVPVNDLMASTDHNYQNYVIIGGGKTGMDAVMHLLTIRKVPPSNLLWVVPNEAWITARENMGSCMELLHTSLKLAQQQQQQQTSGDNSLKKLLQSPQCLQNGFQEWEQLGKIYRLNNKNYEGSSDSTSISIPGKFKDATLNQDELNILKQVPVLRNKGRVREIKNNGDLLMEDGSTTVSLPWKHNNNNVLFVHCSAGAFNYSQHQQIPPPPIFAPGIITLQDVYGTPGFCFVGSILAKMECQQQIPDEQKNQFCLAPQPSTETTTTAPLGPSDGDVAGLSKQHGFVQRLSNLKHWLAIPEIRPWLFSNRLFNLKHLNPEQVDAMVAEMEQVLKEGEVV